MQSVKRLFFIFILFLGLKSIYAATPIITQTRMQDNYGNPWYLTITAIDGKFPSSSLIVDGVSDPLVISGVPIRILIDLMLTGYIKGPSTVSTIGQTSLNYIQNINIKAFVPIAQSYIGIDVDPIQVSVSDAIISFHIVYQ